jgi:alkylated DNA repair protein (DNA oxidative demethylase)
MKPGATRDLFGDLPRRTEKSVERLAAGAVVLRAFAQDEEAALMHSLRTVVSAAPFRHLITPGGYRMSVAMTNCGEVGWVSDLTGYRYDPIDPTTQQHWPAMPEAFRSLCARATQAAGFAPFEPDCCLINRYEAGARLSLHQDRDEHGYDSPIVSVSLGLPATFLFGGLKRSDRPQRLPLESGDVAVWGGPARLAFHGIAPLAEGEHPLTGPYRFNITFRRAL